MSPVWILKRLVSVFINACRLLLALPSLSQFGRGRLSLVVISFYMLSLLFGPCRLLEFILAGPRQCATDNLTRPKLSPTAARSCSELYTLKHICLIFINHLCNVSLIKEAMARPNLPALMDGDMGVYSITVLSLFSSSISVILILMCDIAVSSSPVVCVFFSFWL